MFIIPSLGMCSCTMSGDPHYKTFDGYMIHYMGECKYTVAESLIPDDPCQFHIKVKNTNRGRPRSRVTWTKYVDVGFAGDTVRYNSPTNTIQVIFSKFEFFFEFSIFYFNAILQDKGKK